MIIHRYWVPTKTGRREAFGQLVLCRVAGIETVVVWQFQGEEDGPAECVALARSGYMLAPIPDGALGSPQQRCRAAIDRHLADKPDALVWQKINAAEVLNP